MTNTITYDGVEYRKVKRKAEVGEKVLITNGYGWYDVKVGEVYNVIDGANYGFDEDGYTYVDYAASEAKMSFVLESDYEVLEPTEGTSVEASPSVIELLSNLALRLTKVEAELKPDVDNDMTTQSDSVDNVNSPQHYRHGRFETIELIEDITKKYDDGFVAYCVGNAVKYVDRAPFKHGSPSEDLRKAAWYLTRAAEHTDEKGAV